jgi:hypothetical protein
MNLSLERDMAIARRAFQAAYPQLAALMKPEGIDGAVRKLVSEGWKPVEPPKWEPPEGHEVVYVLVRVTQPRDGKVAGGRTVTKIRKAVHAILGDAAGSGDMVIRQNPGLSMDAQLNNDFSVIDETFSRIMGYAIARNRERRERERTARSVRQNDRPFGRR